MLTEKFCKSCGARNQPYAAFCGDCGASFIPSKTSRLEPPTPRATQEPSGDQEWGRYTGITTASSPPRPRKPSGAGLSRRSRPQQPPPPVKKRYILYGVLVLLLLSTVAGSFSFRDSGTTTPLSTPSSADSPPHQLNEHLIVCIGDSITEGFAAPNDWPYHLQVRLGGDWQVVDQGVGGATTADMLNRTDAALALNPHFVIIMGGTNDIVNGEVPLATTQANIAAICTRVADYGAVPVLCTVIPSSYHLTERDSLNAWIAEYANLNGYPLIDFYPVINNPSNPGHSNPALVLSDGVHPNAAGDAAMGNAIDLAIFTEAP